MIEQHETPSTDATGEGDVINRDLGPVFSWTDLAQLIGLLMVGEIVAYGLPILIKAAGVYAH